MKLLILLFFLSFFSCPYSSLFASLSEAETIKEILDEAYKQGANFKTADFEHLRATLVQQISSVLGVERLQKAQNDAQRQWRQQAGSWLMQSPNPSEHAFNITTQAVCEILIADHGYIKNEWPKKGVYKPTKEV